MDLQPVTTDPKAIAALRATLSLASMPSAGHIVGLDLESVALDLSTVPLDDVLEFRELNGAEYREYARDLRRTIALLSPLPPDERDELLRDRREEMADRADSLRRAARRKWRHPLASVALGLVGAAWGLVRNDPVSAALALGNVDIGYQSVGGMAGAYSYLFHAQTSLSR
jgi:hypothetical protein